MSLRSEFGPRTGWYILRAFRYSWGRIKDRLQEEVLCPEQGKWMPLVMAYPTSKPKAEKIAFEHVTMRRPEELGMIRVVRRPVPVSVRARMWPRWKR